MYIQDKPNDFLSDSEKLADYKKRLWQYGNTWDRKGIHFVAFKLRTALKFNGPNLLCGNQKDTACNNDISNLLLLNVIQPEDEEKINSSFATNNIPFVSYLYYVQKNQYSGNIGIYNVKDKYNLYYSLKMLPLNTGALIEIIKQYNNNFYVVRYIVTNVYGNLYYLDPNDSMKAVEIDGNDNFSKFMASAVSIKTIAYLA
jgi:hypothetical protein